VLGRMMLRWRRWWRGGEGVVVMVIIADG